MIKATQLVKKFDDLNALDNITCEIPQGCIYGLVGSNGAGKSTFLRVLAGIFRQDSGLISVDGETPYENARVKSRIAFVPDDLYFLPGATLTRMSKLYASVYENFDYNRYYSLVKSFNLPDKKPINTFSKGMKRQAATLLALSSRPDYMLFDETFDGLDPIMRNFVKSLICSDVIERNVTAIITSHSLRELEDTCDQLALLHKGGVVLESDVQNLKTSLFKVQIAFNYEYDKNTFDGIDIVNYKRQGSVTNMIVRGDREQVALKLNQLQPVLFDILPLTLEEIFSFEMEALGYEFMDEVEALGNEQ